MRLKEDSSSWKARSIIRRDFRRSKEEPQVTTAASAPPEHRSSVYCDENHTQQHQFDVGSPPEFGLDAVQTVETACKLCGQTLKLHRKGELFDTMTRRQYYESLPGHFTSLSSYGRMHWYPQDYWSDQRPYYRQIVSFDEQQWQKQVKVFMYEGNFKAKASKPSRTWRAYQQRMDRLAADERRRAEDRARWQDEGRQLSEERIS